MTKISKFFPSQKGAGWMWLQVCGRVEHRIQRGLIIETAAGGAIFFCKEKKAGLAVSLFSLASHRLFGLDLNIGWLKPSACRPNICRVSRSIVFYIFGLLRSWRWPFQFILLKKSRAEHWRLYLIFREGPNRPPRRTSERGRGPLNWSLIFYECLTPNLYTPHSQTSQLY